MTKCTEEGDGAGVGLNRKTGSGVYFVWFDRFNPVTEGMGTSVCSGSWGQTREVSGTVPYRGQPTEGNGTENSGVHLTWPNRTEN